VTDPGVVELAGTGLFYVVGSPGAGSLLTTVNSTQIYDSNAGTWLNGPDLPTNANNTSAAVGKNANGINVDVYLEGGYDGSSSTPINYSLTVA
jgi:hypothetical protein